MTVHSYPWYPSDWLNSATRFTMTPLERSIYRDLLDFFYIGGALPPDELQLRQMAAVSPQQWSAAWPRVRREFKKDIDGNLYHEKAREVYVKRATWQEKTRKAGIRSGEVRRQQSLNAALNGSSTNHRSVDVQPTTTTTYKITPPTPSLNYGFDLSNIAERIFQRHHCEKRGGGLPLVEQYIAEQIGSEPDPLAAVQRMDRNHEARCRKWAEKESQFIPKLTNWISSGDWTNGDEPQRAKYTPMGPIG